MTSLSEDNYETGVVDPCLSDHIGQYMYINNVKRNSNIIWRRKITTLGIHRLRNLLSNLDWSIFENPYYNASFLSEFLVNTYSTLINTVFPLQKVNVNSKPPVRWFTDSLRNMRDLLSCIKTICNSTRHPEHIALYNSLKKDYKLQISSTKKLAYDNFISDSDNKARDSWKLINFERNKSNSTKLEHNISPDSFNIYFTQIADKIIDSLPTVNTKGTDHLKGIATPSSSFFLHPITTEEVSEAILKLKNSFCTDIYGINSKILKETIDIIIIPLTSLYNSYLREGIFPDVFKLIKVLPLFKKGEVSNIDNYRPISIIPIFSKIFEIILKSRLTKYLESNRFLDSCQFGFRSKCSTTQAVYKIVT